MVWTNRNLTTKLTVWSESSKDAYGKITYTVTYIKGRWEDKQTKFVDNKGNELLSTAVVFTDTDVVTGSYLFQGKSTATTPTSLAREVKSFSKIPSIRGNNFERKVILR